MADTLKANEADVSAKTVEEASSEKKEKDSKPEPSVAERLPKWMKWFLVILPALAFIISLCSLFVSFSSMRYSMGFTRQYEDHDVIAKVLGVSTLTKGFSTIVTNGELSVNIALINKGNQKEIIRDAFLCYSESEDFQTRGRTWQRSGQPLNIQLDKGEKRVLHLLTPYNDGNTGKRLWLGIVVRAIAPNADDIEVLWPVCQIELPADGNGGWVSYNKEKTPLMQIISNKRLEHQKLAPDGF